MGERRGFAGAIMVLWLLFNLQQLEMVNGETIFNVGDDLGWTFNVTSWPTGKTFHAGDVLGTFFYIPFSFFPFFHFLPIKCHGIFFLTFFFFEIFFITGKLKLCHFESFLSLLYLGYSRDCLKARTQETSFFFFFWLFVYVNKFARIWASK